jgi:hypothetical protein
MVQGKRRARGRRLLGQPPRAAGAIASLPWEGSSSSSSVAPLHHPHYNLLANTLFDAIYYIPMIYYVDMSCVE